MLASFALPPQPNNPNQILNNQPMAKPQVNEGLPMVVNFPPTTVMPPSMTEISQNRQPNSHNLQGVQASLNGNAGTGPFDWTKLLSFPTPVKLFMVCCHHG